MKKQHEAPKPTVLRSAAMMAIGTLASRILGMVRDMVLAAFFPRMVTDAFVVAFRLPNLFRRVLGEGSLAASFVPLYVEALGPAGSAGAADRDADYARRLASSVYTLLAAVTATISVLGIIFMEPLMGLLVSGDGFMQVEGKFEMTLFMAKIMFAYLFLVTTYAFFMSMANSHKKFFLPALAPAGFNLVVIVFSFLPQFRVSGDQLAWGVLAGGVVQTVLAAWPLIELGRMPSLTKAVWVRGSGRFFKTLLPSMVGMSIGQLLGLLNVNFASRLGEGTHSYIYLADRLLEFPQALLSVSLGVALLPTLSELWSSGEREKFVSVGQKNVRLLMVLSLPCAVGLYLLAEPIVRVIYERGNFSAEDTLRTADVVRIYAFVLMVSGLHRVTVPAFYAVKNTWFPAANSAFCLFLHYFIAGWAVGKFGLIGLVGATAFTGALNLGILLVAYKYYFGRLGFVEFCKSALWLTPALLGLGAVCVYASPFFAGAVGLAVTILLAAVAFFLIARLVRHPEAGEVFNLVSRRLGSRVDRLRG